MIDNQLNQLIQGLMTSAFNEVINRDIIPLLSKSNSDSGRLYTYTEAMTKLNISKPTFFKLLRENRLRKVKIDMRTFRIDPKDLEQFIESRKTS